MEVDGKSSNERNKIDNFFDIFNTAVKNCTNDREIFSNEIARLSKIYFGNNSDEELTNIFKSLLNNDVDSELFFKKQEEKEKKYKYKLKCDNELKDLYEISDSLTKRKIDYFLEKKYYAEDVKKEYEDIKNRIDYTIIHQNDITNKLAQNIYSSKKMDQLAIFDFFRIRFVTKNLSYEIVNYDFFKEKFNVSTSKLLIFMVNKINFNTNKSIFSFNEYAKETGITTQTSNRRRFKEDLRLLKSIGNIEYEDKNNNKSGSNTILISHDYTNDDKPNGIIEIFWNPQFTMLLKNTYMYFPKKLLKVKSKNFAKHFMLGLYFFTQMRINFKLKIKISVKSCLDILDFSKLNEIKNYRYKENLINPFKKIIEFLNREIPELYIIWDRDINNIEDFFNANLEVELKNESIKNKYENQNNKKTENKKYRKSTDKQKALKLKESGATIQEISEKLGKSVRTIKRYLGQK